MNNKDLHFKVTNDKYELPIGVCEAYEASKVHGVGAAYVQSKKRGKQWRTVRAMPEGRPKRKLSHIWIRDFYYRVHDLVDKSGKDVRNFAKSKGVNWHIFYSNDCAPSVERLMLLADVLGCTTDYLLGREEAQHGDISKEE